MSRFGHMRKSGWPLAVAFLLAVVLTEVLPLFGGLGAQARFDWSFPYVTSHFVLLPLIAGAHVLWNLGWLLVGKTQPMPQRLKDVASIAVTASYLLLLYFAPVFPFWGELVWENLRGEVLSWAPSRDGGGVRGGPDGIRGSIPWG